MAKITRPQIIDEAIAKLRDYFPDAPITVLPKPDYEIPDWKTWWIKVWIQCSQNAETPVKTLSKFDKDWWARIDHADVEIQLEFC